MNQREAARAERKRLYASTRWRALRSQHLKAQPMCQHCGERGSHVDHIKGHQADWRARFFDAAGLMTLCHSCHSVKTQRHDNWANGARVLQMRAIGRAPGQGGHIASNAEATLSARHSTQHTTGERGLPPPAHRIAAAIQQRARAALAASAATTTESTPEEE